MKSISLGRLTFFLLDDGTLPFPARSFFRNVPEAVWRRYVDVDAEGRIPVGHNYGLVESRDALIVIDTGYGDDTHNGRTGHLLEDFARTGHRREQVTMVVTSHAHGDHIKRNTLLEDGRRVPTFPHARYHLARADWDWFSGPGHVPEFDEQLVSLEGLGLLALVDGELQVTPEVRLAPTPGHTPGHTSVVVESEGQMLIFLGDLCHLPVHVSHPDWTSTFDTHPNLTPRTRAQVFELAVEHRALVVCPHAPSPGLGRVSRSAGGYRWETA
jgi:glyoxylase-like metal-dependent hydrolase (beta-lactamase superfamily II)